MSDFLPDRIGAFLRHYLGNPAEAVIAALLFGFFWLLPMDWASALGGFLLRAVGPRLSVNRIARRNLARVFPEKSVEEIESVLRGMWDNLGRSIGEYPHISKLKVGPGERVEVIGSEWIAHLRDDGKPGIFFSAHLANWELSSLPIWRDGLPVHVVYRAPNNPWVDWIFRAGVRGTVGTPIPKGPNGARQALAVLRDGGHLGMLIDQKMNDGIPIPFFGRDAMTAPALAQLALRYDCPVIPVRIERTKGCRFRITFFPPMEMPQGGDRQADIKVFMTEVNKRIEEWVRARPEQWLWVHRRWPD